MGHRKIKKEALCATSDKQVMESPDDKEGVNVSMHT